MPGTEAASFVSLADALAALADAEEGRHVKAAREIREEIVRRWPNTRAAEDAAGVLDRTRVAAEERARADSRQRQAEERRAREQDVAVQAERQGRLVAAAQEASATVTIAGEARRRAKAEHQRQFVARVWALRALELEESFASRALLAATLRYCGMLEEAREEYRRAWDMADSEKHIVRTGAAAVLADLGQVAEAWDLLRPVFSGHPDDAFALHLAGRIHRLLGNLPAAERYLGRAAGLTFTRAAALRELRILLEQARDAGHTEVVDAVRRRLTHDQHKQ